MNNYSCKLHRVKTLISFSMDLARLRNAGYGTILAASLFGLFGFAEKKAKGGMLLSLSDVPAAQQRGAQATVSRNGNLVWQNVTDGDGQSINPSGIAFNSGGRGHAYIAGHTAIDRSTPSFQIGTGSDFKTDPGQIFTATGYSIFPGYTGPGSLGTSMDIAHLTFDVEIPGAAQLVFASQPLAFGESVQLAGFGTLGVFNDQFYGQTGAAYSGQSVQLGGSLINGANPDLYSRVVLDRFDPTGMRGTQFDSGGWVFRDINGVRVTYGMMTQASDGIGGRVTQYLRMDQQNEVFQSYHASNITAVPEPGSFALVVGGLAVAGWRSSRRLMQRRVNRQY